MTKNNEQPKLSVIYVTTKGTKKITAAATATERFAPWAEEGQFLEFPSMSSTSVGEGQTFMSYASREVESSSPKLMVPTISIPAHIPNTCQEWYWLLGTITDATPDVISVKDTGEKDLIDLHYEHGGGTNEQIHDAVSCYCNGMKWSLGVGRTLIIEESTYETMVIESKEGTVEYHKTDASVALSTTPTEREWNKPFIGISECKWDTGDANDDLPVSEVVFNSMHEMQKNDFDNTDKRRAIYAKPFDGKHDVSFWVICENANQYSELINRTQVNCSVTSTKADGSDYVKFVMTGLNVEDVKTRVPCGGDYVSREIICKYENLTIPFDDGVNYGAAYNK